MAEPGAEPSEAISVEDDNDSRVTQEKQVVLILDKLKAPRLASNTAGGNRGANAKVSNQK